MFASVILTISSLIFVVIGAEYNASSPLDQDANYCVLPPYPENGRYTVSNNPSATPGERYSSVRLVISCDKGYINNNTVKRILCVDGDWSASMPTCDRDLLGFCTLPTGDLTVEYRCLLFPGTLERSWECESLVSAATLVKPICRLPAYFSLKELPEMHCRDGMWDYNPICKPACGLTTQHQNLEGTSGNQLELPWHAVIYSNRTGSYEKRCGGSLISATKIISSAECFYSDFNKKLLPAKNFIVAMNKMYRPYNYSRDRNIQYSHVLDIKTPSSYGGSATYLKDDIAIAVIETLIFHLSVHPVCLDFNNNLDKAQRSEGNSGKAVRWAISGNSDMASEVKNVVDFQYIDFEDCRNKLSYNHRNYLIDDKFCALFIGAARSSTGDFGGGLAFLEPTSQRYYLRGVLSVFLSGTDTVINVHTSIVKYEHFIKQHL